MSKYPLGSPALLLALTLLVAVPLHAQQPVRSPSDTMAVAPEAAAAASARGGWDAPRVLDLVRRAIERRREPVRGRQALRNYRADARGWLYFYLDRDTGDAMNLVRVDQIALEIYWASPGLTKQRIVGRRDQDRLPNSMRYHLDHLTVVQNDFGNVIRMGDGDEVRSVRHPAAPGAESVYQYRLADSLSLYLSGSASPVRVYEVQVRPRDASQPGVVGSIFLDRVHADIVGMRFTFTPASYVDRRLDYIRIALQNGLWEGKYWLPYDQRVEIRRKVPELDFPVGSVIRGRYRITNYRFDVPLDRATLAGPRVVSVPDSALRAFPFEEGLYSDLEAEGLEAGGDLASLRREARHLVGQRFLSGLPRLRFYAPDPSTVLRYDRAEGLFVGAGVSWAARPQLDVRVAGGYGFAARRGSGRAALQLTTRPAVYTLSGYARALRDLGQSAGTQPALSTLSALAFGEDYLDPYFADGVSLAARVPLGHWSVGGDVALEQVAGARLATRFSLFGDSADVRPIRSIEPGRFLETRLDVRRAAGAPLVDRLDAELRLLAGTHGGDAYVAPVLRLRADRSLPGYRGEIHAEVDGGIAEGTVPPQRLFLLGGVGTLPGYAFRGFVGDRYARGELEMTRDVVGSWVAARMLLGAGWTTLARVTPPSDWSVTPSGGVRPFAGIGIGLLSDAARLDVVRGLRGGTWQAIVSSRFIVW